jgi:UDP-N-acetylmuramoyl-tripeptide--D-alanyl-D-alanine ligase
MNELGDRSGELHRGVGTYAAAAGVDVLAAVGEKASAIAEGFLFTTGGKGAVKRYAGNEEAIKDLSAFVKDGDTVLVKGSRSYRTEEIVGALAERRSS